MLHGQLFLGCHSQFASYPYTFASYSYSCKILQPYVAATVRPMHSDAVLSSTGALLMKQEILRTPYLTRHRTGQVERLMARDQIEAKIMKYHTLSGGGMSAVNLAKFNRKILLSSKSN